jgi:chaperonin GroES
MNINPLGDRVVIKPLPKKEKIPGVTLLPDEAQEQSIQGRVLAIGSGCYSAGLGLKIDDIVLYARYAGPGVEIEGKVYLLLKGEDILAIISET